MRYNATDNLNVVSHILPLLRTTTVTPSSGVDLQGYEGAAVILHAGTVTDGTFTPELQESDEASANFTAVADADLDGTETAFTSSVDDRVLVLGYKGTKRYIRLVLTASGSPSTGGTIGCTIVRTDARHRT